jgi:hypothetical protein
VRDAVLEALPCWRGDRYVIRVIDSPIGASKNLLRVVWINYDRIHRNIREIAGLVGPCERGAVGSAAYLENMTRCCWRISIKPAYCSVPHWQIRDRDSGVERDAQHGPQRHNGVIAGNIHPVRLCLSAGSKIKAYPDIGIIVPTMATL